MTRTQSTLIITTAIIATGGALFAQQMGPREVSNDELKAHLEECIELAPTTDHRGELTATQRMEYVRPCRAEKLAEAKKRWWQ